MIEKGVLPEKSRFLASNRRIDKGPQVVLCLVNCVKQEHHVALKTTDQAPPDHFREY